MKASLFKFAPGQIKLFPHLGRAPYTGLSLIVITLSGLAEGFGLTLFLPLLDVLSGDDPHAATEGLLAWVVRAFDFVGIEVNISNLLIIITVTIIGSLLLAYAQRHIAVVAKHTFIRQIRKRLTSAYFRVPWPQFMDHAHGTIVNRMVTETQRSGNALLAEIMCVAILAQMAVFLVLQALLSWQLTLICIGFGALTTVIVLPLIHHGRQLGRETLKWNSRLSFHFLDYLKGGKLIRVTATEKPIIARLDEFIDDTTIVVQGAGLNQAQIQFVVQALPVFLLVGIIAVSHSVMGIPASGILVFIMILARIAPRLAQFHQNYQTYVVARPALEDVLSITEELERSREATPHGAELFHGLQTEIAFAGVSFHYGEDKIGNALTHIDFEIPRGQLVALVGRSGSGKSTLLDILTGLRRPTGGKLLVDGIDLAEIEPASWRRRIGYVPQEITVFNDTVRNNLTFVHPDASDGEVRDRLTRVGLLDTVDAMPDGLNTMLGESGVRLSGGERQRLVLARALMGSPSLLILDEVTSALDNESERQIIDLIESISEDVTTLIIAHRLNIAKRADVIHVLEKGEIVESGTFDQLLQQRGRFADLHGAPAPSTTT